MEKSLVRKTIRERFEALTEDKRQSLSKLIVPNVLKLRDIKDAKIVGAFLPIGKEPDIRPLIKQLMFEGKVVCIPVMSEDGKSFRFASLGPLEALEKTKLGTYEPVQKNFIEGERIDVFLVPGLAFDRQGVRIGRGLGFYDKFFGDNKTNARKIGVAFEIQLMGFELPVERHDILMDLIVTEKMACLV